MSPDTTFGALGVPASLIAVLAERGITSPTPIQTAPLPDSLAGRDVLGRGRTGSGKTYAFLRKHSKNEVFLVEIDEIVFPVPFKNSGYFANKRCFRTQIK